ncbi:MAG: tripartite tricarboxylate transporter substrate binding protein [Rubrivivax sp.]|nr:tripartite tricarboxylate transporter substrate binding protein [Rubrivivax sp.]
MLTKRDFCLATLAAALPNAFAQAWPAKPVTILVPQAPGGTNDAVGRILAQKLSERLGQSFVVDNRVGAGGNIGTAIAAKAPKDGYTLLLTISSTQAINPALYKTTGFDPVKDFDPIAPVGVVPNVLVVNPSFPATTLQAFIADAKAQKQPYMYASAGNGSLNHLLGEMLSRAAGIKLEHVPYKGVAPALNDVLGGQIPMAFASLPSCIGHVRAGKLRALGVSSPRRSPALPDVPAIGELVPGFAGELWVGLFAVAGTPPAIVERLASEVAAAVGAADTLERFAALGVEPLRGGPVQLAAMVRDDIARWAPIVKASGAQVD